MLEKTDLTYRELVNKKKLSEIIKNYNVTQELYDYLYKFMMEHKNYKFDCGNNVIKVFDNFKLVDTLPISKTSISIDGLIVSATVLKIIPHYVASRSSSYGGSSWSSGGGSSNNTNNSIISLFIF